MLLNVKKLIEAYERVKEERIRGAFWSANIMAKAIIEDAQNGLISCDNIDRVTRLIISANVTMASLWNLADVLRNGCNLGYDVLSSARKFLWYMGYSRELLSSVANNLAHEKMIITTLSYSSSIELVLLTLKNYLNKVFISISEPGGEGIEFAKNLRRSGIEVNVIYDAMLPHAVEKSTLVLIGADSVTLDGCVFNKVGSLMLAMISSIYKIPFASIFESFKIHRHLKCNDVKIEYRTSRINHWGDLSYPLFDKIPSSYIKFVITEYGITEFNRERLLESLDKMRSTINES